jgi:hypothetical protein
MVNVGEGKAASSSERRVERVEGLERRSQTVHVRLFAVVSEPAVRKIYQTEKVSQRTRKAVKTTNPRLGRDLLVRQPIAKLLILMRQ